jgi:hypothetical protein
VVGRFSWLTNLCHVSCMVCVVVVIGLGSLVCSWDAGSVSVVARVDRANSSLGLGRGFPRCEVFRVPLLRLVFGVVFVPMILLVILVSWSSRSTLPPIGGLSALRVYLRIVEVGIGFGVL